MKRSFREQVEMLLNSQKGVDTPGPVTPEDLEGLPEPVQRYMRKTQIIGTKPAQTVRLKQQGSFRLRPEQRWMSMEAEEYYTVNPPAFIWYGKVRMMPLVAFEAIDRYLDNQGRMKAKLLSLLKVVDAAGEEMDQGAMMRYLNEMIWFPSALLSDLVEWQAIDNSSARATFSYGAKSVSADFHFDEEGSLVNFIAERYRSVGDDFVLDKWSTPIDDHAELNGLLLPIGGQAIWHLDKGDFSYIRLKITELEYNRPRGFWQD